MFLLVEFFYTLVMQTKGLIGISFMYLKLFRKKLMHLWTIYSHAITRCAELLPFTVFLSRNLFIALLEGVQHFYGEMF